MQFYAKRFCGALRDARHERGKLVKVPESFKLKSENFIKGENMKARTFLACIHLLNFLIGIFVTGYILNSSWDNLESWQISVYVYYILIGFCGVVIACWILMDGKHIGHCAVEIRDLERRILDLERQIDRIRTLRLSKVR